MSQARTFYSKVSGSRVVFEDGHDAHFIGGRYVTSDPEEIRQLEERVARVSSLIYTQDNIKTALLPEVKQNAKSEQEVQAVESAIARSGVQVSTQQEVGAVDTKAPQASDVNVSTVDPGLQKEVFAAQQSNSAAAAAKAAAAANAARNGK